MSVGPQQIYTMPLAQLQTMVEDWEAIHKERHGRIHCESSDCFSAYSKMKDVYKIRCKQERGMAKVYKIASWRNIKTNDLFEFTNRQRTECRMVQKIVGDYGKKLKSGDLVRLSEELVYPDENGVEDEHLLVHKILVIAYSKSNPRKFIAEITLTNYELI